MDWRTAFKSVNDFVHHCDACGLAVVATVLAMVALFGDESLQRYASTDGPFGLFWQFLVTMLGVLFGIRIERESKEKESHELNMKLLCMLESDLKDNLKSLFTIRDTILKGESPFSMNVSSTFLTMNMNRLMTGLKSDGIRLFLNGIKDKLDTVNSELSKFRLESHLIVLSDEQKKERLKSFAVHHVESTIGTVSMVVNAVIDEQVEELTEQAQSTSTPTPNRPSSP